MRKITSLRLRLSRNQAGDTIVEVLIATAIISLILTAAYATASRNANSAQETREHTQAVKIAERQVELLRNSAVQSVPSMPDNNECYPPGENAPSSIDCNNITATGSGARYKVAITHIGGTYTVSVAWDVLGGKTSSVNMRYIP